MSEAVSVGFMPTAAPVAEPKAPSPVPSSVSGSEGSVPDIIDIRRTLVEMNLKDEIFTLFNPSSGPRKLPTLLLYNEKGLQLFEEVRHPETKPGVCAEAKVLTTNIDYVSRRILPYKL